MLKTLIKLQFQKALARYTANSSNKKKNGKKSSFNSPAVYLALLTFVGVVFAFMFYRSCCSSAIHPSRTGTDPHRRPGAYSGSSCPGSVAGQIGQCASFQAS